jgi:5-methylcytosine-specific restriction endonuclease McrA
MKAKAKVYKREHPEAGKEWQRANPDRVREYKRQSQARAYAANPEKFRAKSRKAWAKAYAENPQKFRDHARQSVHKRRAALLNNGAFDVSPKDRRRLAAQPCAHAHYGPCSGRMEEDHILPIARGGSHGIGNLQMLCRFHNGSKNDQLEIEVKGRYVLRVHVYTPAC